MPGRVRGLKGVEIYAIFRIPRLLGWAERLKKHSVVGILLSSTASHLQDSGSNKSPLRERRGGLG